MDIPLHKFKILTFKKYKIFSNIHKINSVKSETILCLNNIVLFYSYLHIFLKDFIQKYISMGHHHFIYNTFIETLHTLGTLIDYK